jgi:hypothetical protein
LFDRHCCGGGVTERAFLFLIVKLIKLFIWQKIKDAIA